jgi:hypothetical protein
MTKQVKNPLKTATFMRIVRKKMVDELKCHSTFGYITKYHQIRLGLAKFHENDALDIVES